MDTAAAPEFIRRTGRASGVGLTPLIDLVFLLVIFFMLTTSFGFERGLNLRFGSAGDTDSSGPALTVRVTAGTGETVLLNGSPMRNEAFRSGLRKLLSGGAGHRIYLSHASRATVQDLVSAIDQIQISGGWNIIITGEE